MGEVSNESDNGVAGIVELSKFIEEMQLKIDLPEALI
jgi:hypothetical protein